MADLNDSTATDTMLQYCSILQQRIAQAARGIKKALRANVVFG